LFLVRGVNDVMKKHIAPLSLSLCSKFGFNRVIRPPSMHFSCRNLYRNSCVDEMFGKIEKWKYCEWKDYVFFHVMCPKMRVNTMLGFL